MVMKLAAFLPFCTRYRWAHIWGGILHATGSIKGDHVVSVVAMSHLQGQRRNAWPQATRACHLKNAIAITLGMLQQCGLLLKVWYNNNFFFLRMPNGSYKKQRQVTFCAEKVADEVIWIIFAIRWRRTFI